MNFLLRARFLPLATLSFVLLCNGLSHAQARCSNKTFRGAFGFTATGTNIMMNAGCDNNGRFVADGKGHMTGALTEGQGGHIQKVQFTGTYTVNPDCTGTAQWVFPGPFKVASSFVLDRDGSRMYFMNAEKGPIVNAGSAKKQSRGHMEAACSDRSFHGPFGLSVLGTKVASNVRFAVTGQIAPDGQGHISGTVTEDVAGEPQQHSLAGTYKVNRDCTGAGKFESPGKPDVNFDFVLVNDSDELYLIYTDDGAEATGVGSRIAPSPRHSLPHKR